MTWGRRYGGIQCIDTSCSPPFINFSHMQDSLSAAYFMIANELNASVCQAGNVWRQSVNTDSTVVLWDADLSHPSPAGTYLTACAFYSKIFHTSSTGANYYGGLPQATAYYLQSIASNFVLNTGNEVQAGIPDFVLHQNYPNPFNSTTVISFDVANKMRIDINVYDTEGRLVEKIYSGYVNRGKSRINWTAKSVLPSGVYFISVSSERQKKTEKVVYLK